MSDKNQIPQLIIERLQTISKSVQVPFDDLLRKYSREYDKARADHTDMTNEECGRYVIMIFWKNYVLRHNMNGIREIRTLKGLLDDIIIEIGCDSYDRDHDRMQFANNIIDNASKNAIEIRKRLVKCFKDILLEGENGEAVKCASSARDFLKDLGELAEEKA